MWHKPSAYTGIIIHSPPVYSRWSFGLKTIPICNLMCTFLRAIKYFMEIYFVSVFNVLILFCQVVSLSTISMAWNIGEDNLFNFESLWTAKLRAVCKKQTFINVVFEWFIFILHFILHYCTVYSTTPRQYEGFALSEKTDCTG